MEHRALQAPGVLHADHDAGEQAFEHPRRREVEGRPDLARVLLHGRLAFRAGDAEARDETLGEGQVVVADPGERQVGHDLVLIRQPVEGDRVACRRDRAAGGQHHALGAAGRAGGVEDDRGVVARARLDAGAPALVEIGVGRHRRAPVRLHGRKAAQPGVVVVAQAPLVVVDHMGQVMQPLLHREHLVDLLLILDDRDLHLGVFEHVAHLVGDRVGVDRHGDGAERLRRQHGPVQPRPVGSDHGDPVAAPDAEALKPDRKGADLVELVRPAPGLPDAEVLPAHRRPRRAPAQMVEQQLRKGVVRRGGIANGRHAVSPGVSCPVPPVRAAASYCPGENGVRAGKSSLGFAWTGSARRRRLPATPPRP